VCMSESVVCGSDSELEDRDSAAVRRCDDDEDCDDDDDVIAAGSSGAAAAGGDFLLLHNDAARAPPASTFTPPSVTPSSVVDHKPPTSSAVPPRGVASKRSGTDSDDSRDAGPGVGGGGQAEGGRTDNAPVTAASTTHSRLAVHIGLIAGSSVGVVVVLLLAALAVYKYRSRDQGSYRLDPDAPNGYVAAPGGERFRLRRTSSSGLAASGPADQNSAVHRLRNARNSRSKARRDVKEWYV